MARARVVKKFNYNTGDIYLVQRKVLFFFWIYYGEYVTLKEATDTVYKITGDGKVLVDVENGKILDKDSEWFTIIEKEGESVTKSTPPPSKRSGGMLL